MNLQVVRMQRTISWREIHEALPSRGQSGAAHRLSFPHVLHLHWLKTFVVYHLLCKPAAKKFKKAKMTEDALCSGNQTYGGGFLEPWWPCVVYNWPHFKFTKSIRYSNNFPRSGKWPLSGWGKEHYFWYFYTPFYIGIKVNNRDTFLGPQKSQFSPWISPFFLRRIRIGLHFFRTTLVDARSFLWICDFRYLFCLTNQHTVLKLFVAVLTFIPELRTPLELRA